MSPRGGRDTVPHPHGEEALAFSAPPFPTVQSSLCHSLVSGTPGTDLVSREESQIIPEAPRW